MALNLEQIERLKPREVIFHNYGVYIVTNQDAYPLINKKDPALKNHQSVVLVSQPDWKATLGVLEDYDFGKTIVLTPELITIAGQHFSDLYERQPEIELALQEVTRISQAKPEATFVIGSPHFVIAQKLPFNAAIVFKNGQTKQVAHKRLLAGKEQVGFNIYPEEGPTAIEDSTLLICRDLIGAQQTRTLQGNRINWYVEQTTGDSSFAERFKDTEFIAPGTQRILVESCWGVGLSVWKNMTQDEADAHYLNILRLTSQVILKMDPNIKQIVICDRAPLNQQRGNVNKPMSAVFFK